MQSLRHLLLIVLLTLLAGPALVQGQATTTLAEARAKGLRNEVTVEGRATSPSGVFTSWSFDQGFTMSDNSGGIYVSVADDLGIRINQRVRVTGTLTDAFGLLQLVVDDPAQVEMLDSGPPIMPTGSINESSEGSIVTVEGTITQEVGDDQPFGFRVFLDDGSGVVQVFIAVESGIEPLDNPVFEPGNRLRVTGLSGQFLDHWELNPRQRSDIRRLTGGQELLSLDGQAVEE